MTWTEISKKTDTLRSALEEALSKTYETASIEPKSFVNNKGDKFTLFTFSQPEVAVGIEYNDADDGDLYYPTDYDGIEPMLEDMAKEIES